MTVAAWEFYGVAVVGAVAIYCLLPRAAGGWRDGLAGLGTLLGLAALAGLTVWMIAVHRQRTLLAGEQPEIDLLFSLLAMIAVASAVRVIVHPQPIYSAVYFVLTVLSVGAILLLVSAQFLAIALVLIYAGAILVTYVFVIMLAQHARGGGLLGAASYDVHARQPLGALLAGFLLLAAIVGPLCDRANWPRPQLENMEFLAWAQEVGDTAAIGQELFRGNLLAVELAGVLLLVAIVGAVALARKRIVDRDPRQ